MYLISDEVRQSLAAGPPTIILGPNIPVFTIIYANPAYYRATGTIPENLIGIGFLEAFPENPDDPETGNVRESRNKLIECVLTKKETTLSSQRYDIPVRGTCFFETRYWQAYNSPVLNAEGNIKYIIHVTIDITSTFELARQDRIAVEVAELKRKEFHSLFMEAPGAVCILHGPDFVYELVNPTYQSIFPGRSLLGKPVLEALPEMNGHPLMEILSSVYLRGETFEGKEVLTQLARHENSQPEEIYWNFIYKPRYNSDEIIDGILVFAYEVTEQVKARKQAEEHADRFNAIMEAMPQISWTITDRGEATFFNKQWYSYTGLSFEQSKGYGWQQVLHPDDLPIALGIGDKIRETHLEQDIEARYKRHDGTYRWHLTRIKRVLKSNGNIDFWIGTSTDIHELKMLQQQKDDFISIASHELKTPLTTLKASLQLLDRMKSKVVDSVMVKLIEQSNISIGKVTGLVNDLLNASKSTQGQIHLRKSRFKPAELINTCCHHIRQSGEYSIILRGDIDLEINADPERIEQVLINFVNNAIKYAPQSKEIFIEIMKEGSVVKISVTDTGPGIAGDKVSNLFDRYYRADSTGMQYSGLGLGLYISAEIIKKHDGNIGVISDVGKGSTFWFTIPTPP
ncbi:PAS domain-containing sensor histidine kinase [Desertivirga xinjiangensis]|uniref:PAS domain-containing sensor histidine kinase n=1 Tax=Desertivirga xinjiangensis TaxID=539206 RepID=UPI00210CDDC2|nr:ATP-binding protein [Pedobacter xinjiangensis]